MIISISGAPGSGKTSVARILAEKLGMRYYSMGDLRGKMAMERGITLDELNRIGETDRTTDTSVDDYQRELGTKEDHFIAEGRLSWHFIPHSFKIYLTCDPKEAARRIYLVQRSPDHRRVDEVAHGTIEETQAALEHRVASDVLRYQTHYGIDYQDLSHYDLIVDTTKMKAPQETAEKIQKELEKHG